MKNIFIIILFLFSQLGSKSQVVSDNTLDKIINTTNIQKTANSKDILTTLFNTGIDNLLGKEHSFKLNSSFYGIDSIFRGKNAKKYTYAEERKLRQKSFNIELTGDSVNNIKKISGGFTIAVKNRKDITLHRIDSVDKIILNRKVDLVAILFKAAKEAIKAKYAGAYNNSISLQKAVNDSWNDADKNEDFTKLHPYLKEALISLKFMDEALKDGNSSGFTESEIEEAIKSLLSGKNPAQEQFKEIGERYSRKALWTISPTASYDNENKQGEFSFASAFTVGIGNNIERKPWEIEIKSQFKIGNDSSIKETNYNNKPFFFSIGVNKVLIETDEKEPKMEFKFFTQYDYQFGKVAVDAKAGAFTLNSTLRVSVFKSLWLPITLKYDPENGNFLGLFSITANIGN